MECLSPILYYSIIFVLIYFGSYAIISWLMKLAMLKYRYYRLELLDLSQGISTLDNTVQEMDVTEYRALF